MWYFLSKTMRAHVLCLLIVLITHLFAPSAQAGLSTKQTIPEFLDIADWLNTTRPYKKDFEGMTKIIAFASLNSPRSATMLKVWQEWQKKYIGKKFMVILIVSPHYDFEKEDGYFDTRVKALRFTFPVVYDKNRTLWNLYNNLSELNCYYVDAQNRIRKTQSCLQDFTVQEEYFRGLIKEVEALDDIEPTDPTTFPKLNSTRPTGIPMGFAGASYRGNTENARPGEPAQFVLPEYRIPGRYYFDGPWFTAEKSNSPGNPGAALIMPLQSAEFSVLGRSTTVETAKVIVTINAEPVPKNFIGPDLISEGGQTYVMLLEARLYQIIKDWNTKRDGEIKLVFERPEAELFEIDAGD